MQASPLVETWLLASPFRSSTHPPTQRRNVRSHLTNILGFHLAEILQDVYTIYLYI